MIGRATQSSLSPRRLPGAPRLTLRSASTGFVRLLASDRSAHGLAFESPLSRIKHHLERLSAHPGKYAAAYADAARRIAFARRVEKRIEPAALASLAAGLLPLSRLTCAHMARRIVREAKTHGSAVFPCDTLRHAFLMELVANPSGHGPWMLRIYNSGDGLSEHHTRRAHGKVQTMFEVRNVAWGPGPHNLNIHELAKLLRRQVQTRKVLGIAQSAGHEVDDIYTWATRKGQAYNPPRNTAQAEQKVGNCTLKCILSYLRNNLDDVPYCEARAALFEANAEAYATKQHRFTHPELVTRMQTQALAARAKAQRAQAVHRARRNARTARYMHPQSDVCAVRASFSANAQLGRALYCLFYRPDMRYFTLAAECRDTPEIGGYDAVRPCADASGFTVDGIFKRFESLEAIAQHMERRGFTPCTVPAPAPTYDRGEWLTRLSEQHADLPAFQGVMSRGQADSVLRAARPQARYLVRCDPSSERFFFSCARAPSQEAPDPSVAHIAVDIDPYTGHLMCSRYAMTLPTLPDMVAAILVQTEGYELKPLAKREERGCRPTSLRRK